VGENFYPTTGWEVYFSLVRGALCAGSIADLSPNIYPYQKRGTGQLMIIVDFVYNSYFCCRCSRDTVFFWTVEIFVADLGFLSKVNENRFYLKLVALFSFKVF
jgi:hypothetical protein